MKSGTKLFFLVLAILGVSIYSQFCDKPDAAFYSDSRSTASLISTDMESLEQNYEHALHYLMIENGSLNQQLQNTKTALQQSKEKNTQLKTSVQGIARRIKSSGDTISKIIYCDSLAIQVDTLIIQSAIKDSLYEAQISELNKIITNRNSTISVYVESYNGITALLDTSLAIQTKQEQDLKKIHKQFRRKGIENKIAIGLAAIFAATFLLFK